MKLRKAILIFLTAAFVFTNVFGYATAVFAATDTKEQLKEITKDFNTRYANQEPAYSYTNEDLKKYNEVNNRVKSGGAAPTQEELTAIKAEFESILSKGKDKKAYKSGNTTIYPDGRMESVNSDGNTVVTYKNGTSKIFSPSGQDITKQIDAKMYGTPPEDGANIDVCFSWGIDFVNIPCVLAYVSSNLILRGASLLVIISGVLFDTVIEQMVIKMTPNLFGGGSSTNKDAAINQGWKVFRDITNIMFIFVLVYIGIMTIVKGTDSSGTSRMLATVIIVALVINFSLLFTKMIIDTSNILAINFYKGISTAADSSGGVVVQGQNSGIAGSFINAINVQSIYDDAKFSQKGNYEKIVMVSIGGAIVFVILAIILFIASIMLVGRFIILAFVLMTSAAAAGSYILPNLKSMIADKWWPALWGQAFFAPIFMLMLWITLKMTIAANSTFKVGSASWSDLLFNGNVSGAINIVLMFIFIIGMLIMSLIASKQLADTAGDGSKKLNTWLGGAAAGTVAWAGRRSLGSGARAFANSSMAKNSAIGRWAGRRADTIAKSSFDVRGSKTFQKVAEPAKVDFGKAGGAGGFAKIRESAIKKQEDKYENVGKMSAGEENKKLAAEEAINKINKEQKLGDLEKEIKETEETIKKVGDSDPVYKRQLEGKLARTQREYAVNKQAADQATKPHRDVIKSINAGVEKRKEVVLNRMNSNMSMVTKKVATLGMGIAKNKAAATKIRQKNAQKQSDEDKRFDKLAGKIEKAVKKDD